MRNPTPQRLGSTELWSAKIHFPKPKDVEYLQQEVTEYTRQTGTTIISYYEYHNRSMTFLRWPETREEYLSTPLIPECNLAVGGLAKKLQAQGIQPSPITGDRLHTMMGREQDGYNKEGVTVAPLSRLTRSDLSNFRITEGHMISARALAGRKVIPYGEPVGILIVDAQDEAEIHRIAENLQQWHYAIERGPDGITDLYETHWAHE